MSKQEETKSMNLQVGDTVYNLHDGKGIVTFIDSEGMFPVKVQFKNNPSYSTFTLEGYFGIAKEESRRLSYTPVTVKGMTTKRPFNWKEYIGKLCIFYEVGNNGVHISKLHNFIEKTKPVFLSENHQPWGNCLPYTIENLEKVLEDLKLL